MRNANIDHRETSARSTSAIGKIYLREPDRTAKERAILNKSFTKLDRASVENCYGFLFFFLLRICICGLHFAATYRRLVRKRYLCDNVKSRNMSLALLVMRRGFIDISYNRIRRYVTRNCRISVYVMYVCMLYRG